MQPNIFLWQIIIAGDGHGNLPVIQTLIHDVVVGGSEEKSEVLGQPRISKQGKARSIEKLMTKSCMNKNKQTKMEKEHP